MHSAVPVLARVCLQRGEKHRQDDVPTLCDERDDILIVPEKERALRNLEVGRVYASRNEPEERLRHLRKLSRLCELKQLLQLVQEHHLLAAISVWPVLDEPAQDYISQLGVLLQVLQGEASAVHTSTMSLKTSQQSFNTSYSKCEQICHCSAIRPAREIHPERPVGPHEL